MTAAVACVAGAGASDAGVADEALGEVDHDRFIGIITQLSADPAARAPLCQAVASIGPPTYHPTWMISHGMGAFVGGDKPELVPDFDAHWFEIYGRVAKSGKSIRFTEESKAMNRWFDELVSHACCIDILAGLPDNF